MQRIVSPSGHRTTGWSGALWALGFAQWERGRLTKTDQDTEGPLVSSGCVSASTPSARLPAPSFPHVLMDFERADRIGEFLGQPGESRLRRAPDRLRGGPDAPGGAVGMLREAGGWPNGPCCLPRRCLEVCSVVTAPKHPQLRLLQPSSPCVGRSSPTTRRRG